MTNPSNISSGERAKAEAAYTLAAYNYPKDPVGSRDWTLYYGGWLHRAALATQPAPAELQVLRRHRQRSGRPASVS